MTRSVRGFMQRRRTNAANRRARALHKAAAEMKLREQREGSIWRSGKGGAHHDH